MSAGPILIDKNPGTGAFHWMLLTLCFGITQQNCSARVTNVGSRRRRYQYALGILSSTLKWGRRNFIGIQQSYYISTKLLKWLKSAQDPLRSALFSTIHNKRWGVSNPGSQLQTPDLSNIRQINCDSFKTSLTQQGSNCLPARIRHLRILRSFGYSLMITPCLGHYAWRVQAQNPVLLGPQQRSLLNLRKVLYGLHTHRRFNALRCSIKPEQRLCLPYWDWFDKFRADHSSWAVQWELYRTLWPMR